MADDTNSKGAFDEFCVGIFVEFSHRPSRPGLIPEKGIEISEMKPYFTTKILVVH